MSRRVGIIVEGPSDKPVVERLLDGTNVAPIVRVAGGDKILTDAPWITERLYGGGVDTVVALKDSHCHLDIDGYRTKVMQQMGNVKGLKVCVVVHAIEAWLLADEAAVGERLKARTKAEADPEKHCEPDEVLNHIFREHGRTYVKRVDAPLIAASLHRDVVRQRCRSFAAFLDVLGLG